MNQALRENSKSKNKLKKSVKYFSVFEIKGAIGVKMNDRYRL